jgi:hypothetical protein
MGKFKLICLSVLFSAPLLLKGQKPDLSVSITDLMINKVFAAVGSIADEDEFKLLMIKGTYSWLVENARVKLEENKAMFIADVKVKAGPLKYADHVSGLLDVTYNPKNNKLELRLTHAYLKIKTKVFGKERTITTIDLANYYKTPFLFDGPIAYEEVFEIEMPDKTIKRLQTIVRECDIKVKTGEIRMDAVIDIYDADQKVDVNAPVIRQDEDLKKSLEELEKLEEEPEKKRKKDKKKHKKK